MFRRTTLSGRLTSCFAVSLAAFLLLNLFLGKQLGQGVDKLSPELFSEKEYHRPLYGTWSWWLAKEYVEQKTTPDVVLLGSSQMNSAAWAADAHYSQQAIDCLTHRRVGILESKLNDTVGGDNVSVFNCAIGGAMASDYYMIARALFAGSARPQLVVVGVSPRDFIDNKLPAASATEPFRFFSQFVDTGKLTALAYPDPIARLNAQLAMTVEKLPLRQCHAFVEQYFLTKKNSNKSGGNQLLSAIWNAAQVVKPGEWMVPANMAPIFVDNSHEYVTRYRDPNPPSYPIQLAFFDELLGWLKSEHVKVLVVGMPTLDLNRNLLTDTFWSSYKAQISGVCRHNDAVFYDLSANDGFLKGDYVDTVHLNAVGGAKLLRLFADEVACNQTLVAAIVKGDGRRLARH